MKKLKISKPPASTMELSLSRSVPMLKNIRKNRPLFNEYHKKGISNKAIEDIELRVLNQSSDFVTEHMRSYVK
jgi:hypothetical protein